MGSTQPGTRVPGCVMTSIYFSSGIMIRMIETTSTTTASADFALRRTPASSMRDIAYEFDARRPRYPILNATVNPFITIFRGQDTYFYKSFHSCSFAAC